MKYKKNYRNRQEIFYEILSALPARKTRILYKAMIAYNTHYVEYLLELGMIRYDPVLRIYNITEIGQHYMKVYKMLEEKFGGKEGK